VGAGYSPAEQPGQNSFPVSAEQNAHDAEPGELAYLPTSQTVHAASEEASLFGDAFPGEHDVQDVEELCALYVPTGHGEHAETSLLAAAKVRNLPGGHDEQISLPSPL
jgi:hypothetical protein